MPSPLKALADTLSGVKLLASLLSEVHSLATASWELVRLKEIQLGMRRPEDRYASQASMVDLSHSPAQVKVTPSIAPPTDEVISWVDEDLILRGEEVSQQLEKVLGRPATDEELAAALGLEE